MKRANRNSHHSEQDEQGIPRIGAFGAADDLVIGRADRKRYCTAKSAATPAHVAAVGAAHSADRHQRCARDGSWVDARAIHADNAGDRLLVLLSVLTGVRGAGFEQ